MEILLRRASSLARACASEAQTIVHRFETDPELRFSAHVTDGEDQSVIVEQLAKASKTTMQDIHDVLDLLQAQSKIRALAGRANSETAVNDLIAERDTFLKAADRHLNSYLMFSNNAESHEAGEVSARLKGIRSRMQTVTTGPLSDSVKVPRLTSANVTALRDKIADLARRQREVSDELAQANIGRKITLPDDVVKVLRKHKII